MKNFEKYKTAEERSEAFRKFCTFIECKNCKLRKSSITTNCSFTWLDLEAEEEKPLPCPFCGGEVEIQDANNGGHWVLCKNEKCLYSSGILMVRDEAISAHNRMAKSVMEIEAKHD